MNSDTKLDYGSELLYAFGAIFTVGLWAMTKIWPFDWGWDPGLPEYPRVIIGAYATPMLLQASVAPAAQDDLVGDILALFLIAIIFWYLLPKRI